MFSELKITPFTLPFIKPFTFAGQTVNERTGFYIEAITQDGLMAKGEVAPLPGISQESLKKAKHDLEQIIPFLKNQSFPMQRTELEDWLKKHEQLSSCCPSVKFGIESTLFLLAAQSTHISLAKFLEVPEQDMPVAALLQGSHEQVLIDAKELKQKGCTVFKLKVGDRNIPLDVKKVQELRAVIGKDASIRLDGNRVWSFNEAVLFAQLAGLSQIEFIEEPLSDMARLNEFYQATHMPVALDETLAIVRCGVSAPGRCMPTLATQDGVKAYVIKPMILGGIVTSLEWIEEARRLGKKAIISSAFESPVGLEILKVLATLTGQPSGLGTQRWLRFFPPPRGEGQGGGNCA